MKEQINQIIKSMGENPDEVFSNYCQTARQRYMKACIILYLREKKRIKLKEIAELTGYEKSENIHYWIKNAKYFYANHLDFIRLKKVIDEKLQVSLT